MGGILLYKMTDAVMKYWSGLFFHNDMSGTMEYLMIAYPFLFWSLSLGGVFVAMYLNITTINFLTGGLFWAVDNDDSLSGGDDDEEQKKLDELKKEEMAFYERYYTVYDAAMDNLRNLAKGKMDLGGGGGGVGGGGSGDIFKIPDDELRRLYYLCIRDKLPGDGGEIIMCYDWLTESFAYYAKNGQVPYRYLESVGMKYVCDMNCPQLFVDIRKEYEVAAGTAGAAGASSGVSGDAVASGDGDKGSGDSDKGSGDSDKKDSTSVFATFKSYNRVSSGPENKKNTHENNKVVASSSSKHILRERSNRYSYRGKVEDFGSHHSTYLSHLRGGGGGGVGGAGGGGVGGGGGVSDAVENHHPLDKKEEDLMLLSYRAFKKRSGC